MTDIIEKGEVKVAYCLTENMLVDFFMKPLQASAFQRMSDTLSLPSSKKASEEHMSVLRKRKNDGLNYKVKQVNGTK